MVVLRAVELSRAFIDIQGVKSIITLPEPFFAGKISISERFLRFVKTLRSS